MTATHFDKEFFAFFRDLKKNNDRDWFNANKPRYESSIADPVWISLRRWRNL